MRVQVMARNSSNRNANQGRGYNNAINLTLASTRFDAKSRLKRAKTQPKAKAGYRKH